MQVHFIWPCSMPHVAQQQGWHKLNGIKDDSRFITSFLVNILFIVVIKLIAWIREQAGLSLCMLKAGTDMNKSFNLKLLRSNLIFRA